MIVIIFFILIIIIPLSLQCRVASLIHNQPSDQRSGLHEQQSTYFSSKKIMMMIMMMMVVIMMVMINFPYSTWRKDLTDDQNGDDHDGHD